MNSEFVESKINRGLNKLGNIILPGDFDLPSFSKAELNQFRFEFLEPLPAKDRQGMEFLLFLFCFLPSSIIKLILIVSEKSNLPFFSQLRLGLKGICFTLYYGKTNNHSEEILKKINYATKVNRPTPSNEIDLKHIKEIANQSREQLSKISIKDKIKYLKKLKQVILKRKEEIIYKIHFETHKTKTDILMSEIFGVLDNLDFLIHQSEKNLRPKKVKTPFLMLGKKSWIELSPIGNVLIISPWNYPFYQAITPITINFICGNGIIYKPSEFTPLTGLIESILQEAGFKSNWTQIIYGDGSVGSQLIDLCPDKIFFTGSVSTGKKILSQASIRLIPVELELGGKDPMIVFDDVTIERTVKGALWGALTASGQSCTSVERLYVHTNIYDQFVNKLLEVEKELKPEIDYGQMTNEAQVQIVADHVQDAIKKGAKLLTGKHWDFKNRLIPPMILDSVNTDMKIITEETFGPILPIIKFFDETEVIQMANDSKYGLSASIWSKDLIRAKRVASKIVTGNVSINNVMLTEGNHHLPFGGTKESGFGRFKGSFSFHSFCNVKSIIMDNNSSKIESNWYPYTEIKYSLFSKLVHHWYIGGFINKIKALYWGIKMEHYSQKAKH